MTNKRCKVLGYNIDLLSFKEAVSFVLNKTKINEGLHVITMNPEIMAFADKNEEYKEIIKSSGLVIPESSGIKAALRYRGIKQEQIPGIDFSKELLNQFSKLNYPVALIGAKEEILQKACKNLKTEFPSLNIVYSHNGYYENEDIVVKQLISKNPKLILCAIGAPKQDFFINKCKKLYENGIYIGVGGSFDVWAGEVKRAPVIFRKLGLEWAYRTINQPSRIKRIYKTLPMFLFRAIIEGIKSH